MNTILFLTPYPINKAPSQRLKFEQYYEEIKLHSFNIDTNSFISEQLWDVLYKKGAFLKKFVLTFLAYLNRWSILFSINKYDLIYIHLWGTPFGLPIFEWCLRKLSKRLIYDIDDLVFLGESSSVNSKLSWIKGARKIHYLMKHADHIITCTPTLDAYVKNFNSNTTDISSTVDTKKRYVFNESRFERKEKIIIGWSGSHSTSKYLYLLLDVLKKLAQEFDFTLMVMGDKSFKLDGVHVEGIDWNENHEMEILNQFDIGLYPLPDEPWIYGKSGLKAIQYQALGIPVVASNLGANTRVIKNNETGFLVQWDSNEEWYKRIKQLITDAEFRKEMGFAGRKHVVDNFSVSSTKQTYLDVLNKVLSS